MEIHLQLNWKIYHIKTFKEDLMHLQTEPMAGSLFAVASLLSLPLSPPTRRAL